MSDRRLMIVGVIVVGWSMVVAGGLWADDVKAAPTAKESAASPQAEHSTLSMAAVSGGGTDQQTDSEHPVQPLLISMEFQDANLKDVLRAFSQQTGINVIASEDVGERKVTLYLEDVTVIDALDQILASADLVYERPAGSQIYIVKPKTKEGEAGSATDQRITRVYKLRFARVSSSRLAKAAEALSNTTLLESQQFTQSSAQAGGQSSSGSTSASTSSSNSNNDIGIDKVVKKLLTEQGEVMVDERTNSLIVTDMPSNFPRIEAVLIALDIKTPQILVEAEVLETSLAKLKDLGFEWGTGSEGSLFTLTPASRTTRFPFGTSNVAPSQASKTSLTTGTLNTAQAVGVLQALQRDTDTKILARPKVLTLDNESAVIKLTSHQTIGFQTTTSGTSGTTSSQPERTTTGVVLVVTPQVNEGGYVTMLVEPSVTRTTQSLITPPSTQGDRVLDPKTRSARAMVRIRQGETLVLGGLIDRSESGSLSQVPVLSGIPFLGEAFKNKETDSNATELIVFVTPRILGEPGGSQVAAAQAAVGTVGLSPLTIREQEANVSRQDVMDDTMQKLERPRL